MSSGGPTDVEAVEEHPQARLAGEGAGSSELHRSAAGRRAGPGRSVMVLAAAVGLVGLVFLLYAASIHANSGNSDGASVVLEGQAMAHGHFLLNGWGLSLDSFWTVDALFYTVAILLGGLRPGLLYAVPAVLAALVILAGVLMAREGRRGTAAVAGGATVVALLAFPTHAMAIFFLRGPLHIGTTLWALIAFACLRKGRFGWQWVVAVLFLAAGALGDLQILVYGIVPIFLAGLVAMLRTRSWRGGIAQATAAVAGLVLAEIVRQVAKAIGTFGIGKANPTDLHLILPNLRHAASLGADLIGVRSTVFGSGGTPSALQYVRIAAALVMAAGFIAGLVMLIRDAIGGRQRAEDGAGMVPASTAPQVGGPVSEVRGPVSEVRGPVSEVRGPASEVGGPVSEVRGPVSEVRGPASEVGRPVSEVRGPAPQVRGQAPQVRRLWALDDMLLIAVFGPPIAYGALALNPTDGEYARYLTAGVVFAAILAGRMVARAVAYVTASSEARGVAGSSRRLRLLGAAAGAVGVAVVLCFAAGLGYNLAQPDPGQPAANLASFLESHSLTKGVGSYWSASITTVESRGQVTVRPVVAGAGNRIRRYTRESTPAWYAGQHFQFFVYDLAIPWGSDNAATAATTWGPPAHVYDVGTFRVLVWHKPLVFNPDPAT